MQFAFNTNWSRWIGTADWTWVGHEGKLKCYLKFPLNAGLWFGPAPSFMHCLRLACACLLPVPSCQGCVLQLWSVRETPEQGRVLPGTCAMLWLTSQRAFLVGRRTLRRSVAVVVWVVAPGLLRAALLSPDAWGNRTTSGRKRGVIMESVVLQWACIW